MANATFSLFERGAKWYVNLNLEGHKTSRFGAYTREDAHKRGIQLCAEYLKDPQAFFNKSRLKGSGIRAMAQDFYTRALDDKTVEGNVRELDAVLDAYNLSKPEQIDKYLLLRLKKDMARDGYADGTIRFRLRVLRAFVRFCLDKSYLKNDPWPNRTEQASGGEPILPHYESAGYRYTDKEIASLLELPPNPSTTATRLRQAIRLALNQGWRATPVYKFCWENIDFERQTYRLGKMKGGKEKHVDLLPVTMELIAEFGERKEKGRLFDNWDSPKAISKAFHRLRAAKEVSKGRFHDLKHTCISKLQERGFTLKQISEFTNTSVAALQYYTHVDKASLKEKLSSFAPSKVPPNLKVVGG